MRCYIHRPRTELNLNDKYIQTIIQLSEKLKSEELSEEEGEILASLSKAYAQEIVAYQLDVRRPGTSLCFGDCK